VNLVETAQRLADDVLFPAALATDASERLPVELLDVLAAEGLYGIVGPESADGAGANLLEFCAVIEALASGCLTTTFVWVQHHGAVRAAMLTENEAVRDWLPTLCRGGWRAGLALGGAIAGEPRLVARKVDAGWQLDGVSPFVSGWGRIDVVLTLARTEDGRLVSLLLDARENETLAVSRLRLVALNATATVSASFRGHVVPGERVTSIAPYVEGPTPPEVIRIHAAQALGVASRCCRLLGPSPLDEELALRRAELDRLDPETVETARAEAGELAARAAAALAVHSGSRSLLLDDHPQRLAREALFTLVYALRPDSRVAALRRLGAGLASYGSSGRAVPGQE
jgi:alkylation response protein AidB-like acyl-CoA dehydrogenase